MNGLYGNILTAFKGQFIEVDYFDMLPLANSGYDNSNSTVVQIEGVFQNMKGSVAKTSNGNLITVQTGEFWSNEELKIGWFIKYEDVTYRIVPSNNWNREGGFFNYSIEQVVGDDGSFTFEPNFNKGEDNYS